MPGEGSKRENHPKDVADRSNVAETLELGT